MAVKKLKKVVKSKPKAKAAVKAKPAPKKAKVKAAAAKPKPALKAKAVKANPPAAVKKPIAMKKPVAKHAASPIAAPVISRAPSVVERRPVMPPRPPRLHQFSYMKAPGLEYAFEVGDNVEVFCDHEKSRERIRGWIKGIVVQVDNKMVAVQFRSNVFLTDGWMVPDRILWYPLNSEHIRALPGKNKAVKKDFIPEY